MAEKKNIAFLLGAGFSQAAGMPCTSKLTNHVFRKLGIVNDDPRPAAGMVIRQSGPRLMDFAVDCNLDQIGRLAKLIVDILGSHARQWYTRDCTYEELYYVVDHMEQQKTPELENPLFTTLLFDLKDKILKCNGVEEEKVNLMTGGAGLIKETIEAAVAEHILFSQKECDLTGLDVFDVLSDEDHDRIYLFTLNHDTLIEKLLRERGIPYSDGFASNRGGINRWNIEEFDKHRANLCKLHGSLDWRRENEDSRLFFPTVVRDEIIEVKLLEKEINRRRVLFLSGTLNKYSEYAKGIFADGLFLLQSSLTKVDRLIILGYSFGDLGINDAIFNWLDRDINNKANAYVLSKDEKKRIETMITNPGMFDWIKPEVTGLTIFAKDIRKLDWEELKRDL